LTVFFLRGILQLLPVASDGEVITHGLFEL
jgi:hypothetical protein